MVHSNPIVTMVEEKAEKAAELDSAARQSRRGPRTTFWFAFWLGVVLFGAKAAYVGLPEFTSEGLKGYISLLVVASHTDLLFAAVVGLVGQVAVLASARWPRLERTAWCVFIIFCLVSAFYAVLNLQIFAYLRSPLTYPLIYLAGDVKNMRSSVGAFVSLPLVFALAGAPVFFLVAATVTHRRIQPARTGTFRLGQVACAIVLLVYVVWGRLAYAGAFCDRSDRRIAENPHWTLISSYLTEFFGTSLVQLDEQFAPEDLEDFRTIDERRAGEASAFPIDQRPRNVIVLVLESTGTQLLSLYGSPYRTTPRLEAEAANSLVFDRFYCHVGLTANAVVAIGISIYPGMTWKEYTVEHPNLPGTSLAESLRPHGYRTAFIHNGDLEYVNQRGFLRNRGFNDVWDRPHLCERVPDWNFSWGVEDKYLVDGVLRWIDQDPDRNRPFFTLAWTIQAHHPYTLQPDDRIDFFDGQEPPGDDGYHLDLYLNVLRETDRQIGRLLDGLRERGLADDTLVVITGDHGEAFGFPHETYGHGGKLYDENVKVPFLLWNPRLFSGGQRSTAVGGQVDLNPTVLDILGFEPPASWQGRSMLDPERPPRAYFYAANDDYLLGVRESDWKYIYNATLGREQLFDLSRDPQEQTNVAADHPALCLRLRQRLAAWLRYEEGHLAKLHRASVE